MTVTLRAGGRILFIAALAGLLAAAPPPDRTAARALLVRAYPAPGSVLRFIPPFTRLWFNEELSPDLSGLTVFGPRGVTTVAGTGGVDGNDPTRRSMVSDITPLRAGVYTVRWRAASARDLSVTQGSFQFTVKP